MTNDTDTQQHDRVLRIKRIAGMISRDLDMPHQKALDAITRMKGHTHWGSFAESISIDPDSIGGAEATADVHGGPRLFDRPQDYGLDGIAGVLARVEAGVSLIVAGGTSSLKDDMFRRLLLATRKKAHLGILTIGDAMQIPYDRPNWETNGVDMRAGGIDHGAEKMSALMTYSRKEKEAMFIEEMDTDTAMEAVIGTSRMVTTVYVPSMEGAFDRIIELATSKWSEEDRALRVDRFRQRLAARFCVVGMGSGYDGQDHGVVGTMMPE